MSKTKKFRKRGDEQEKEEEEEKNALLSGKAAAQNIKPKPKPKPKQQLLSFAEDDTDDPSGTPPRSSSKPPKKPPPPPRSSLLSFEGADEEQTPKIGSSSRSKKNYGTGHGSGHKMGGGREKPQSVLNVYSQAGEYTPERLQELHKNTIRLGGSKPPQPPETKTTDEPFVILKGTIKPVATPGDDATLELPAVVMDVDETEHEPRYGDGTIPDAAAIAAAKLQRERKRMAQTAPDYIPLATGHGEYRTRSSESVVVVKKKEEAESSEDETEVRGRLSFIGSKTNGKAGVFEIVESVEEEDEEKIWEEEQLKKGVGKRVEEAVGAPALLSGNAQGVPGLPESLSAEQEAETVMNSLQQGLMRLQESHARTKSELYTVEQNMNSSAANVQAMEENLTAAGKKYVYMQKLRDYISSLCDFLQEKSPMIEQLEEHMLKLHEDRASAVFQRRRLDRSDEKAEVEAAISGKGQAQAASAAVSAIDLAPQLDEFGRDVNLQKRQEKKMRAEGRNRRRARRNAEPECSSEESENEEKAFKSGWDDTLETAEKIFSDAAEEFSQLEMVKNRLKIWSQDYPAAYRDAFVKLSAPAIFAPFVRLELLRWDPLRDITAFQDMRWYSLLVDYDDHPDLIPSLIEKIALPRLHHNLEYCWDRLSTRGTVNAVAAVLEILAYVPASSQALQELITMVKLQLIRAVSETEVPTWSAQVLNAVPEAAEVSARRFGASVRLLRNIGLWNEVLPKSALDQVGLDELLYGRILPHMRVLTPADAIGRAGKLVEALHGTWIGKEVKEISPKLGGFVQHVAGLGRALEKKPDAAGVAGLLRKILLDLNENEQAAVLATVFQLK